MIGDLAAFGVLVALVVGAALLVRRASRAKRRVARVAGMIGAGLLTILLAVASVLAIQGLRWIHGKVPVAAPDLRIEATPERVQRGQYLVNIACVGCHGHGDSVPLSGGLDIAADIPMPIGKLVTANISSDGVIKDRTDGELFRVLRHGVGKGGGRRLLMGVLPNRHLSDDDVMSIIAYLRHAPPSNSSAMGGDDINILGAILLGAGLLPKAAPPEPGAITAPPRGPTAEYGSYATTFGDCRGCHGDDMRGTAASMAGPGAPNPRPSVASWSFEQFRSAMRTGVRPNGLELKMPWRNAAAMDDQDLAALYAYLRQP